MTKCTAVNFSTQKKKKKTIFISPDARWHYYVRICKQHSAYSGVRAQTLSTTSKSLLFSHRTIVKYLFLVRETMVFSICVHQKTQVAPERTTDHRRIIWKYNKSYCFEMVISSRQQLVATIRQWFPGFSMVLPYRTQCSFALILHRAKNDS